MTKLQYHYDWREINTKAQFEEAFGFPFEGPGIYHTANDTILALADDATHENAWHHRSREDYKIECLVWNCPIQDTYLSIIGRVPTRTH